MDGDPPVRSLDLNLMASTLSDSLVGCDVVVDKYCDGYEEVIKDVRTKVGILREHASKNGELGDNYKTVLSMSDYEQNKGVLSPNPDPGLNGCRTLLRLHRALLFVIKLLNHLCSAPERDTLSNLVQTAYNDTLADYHPWAIRKAVGFAVYALPDRKTLINNIVSQQLPSRPSSTSSGKFNPHIEQEQRSTYILNDPDQANLFEKDSSPGSTGPNAANKMTLEQCREMIENELIPIMQRVYDTIQLILSERNLLNLS